MAIQTYDVEVGNLAPVVVVGEDITDANEGDAIPILGSFTDAGTEDNHTYLWEVLSSNGQTISPVKLTGDFDVDGHVDGSDLAIWRAGFGTMSGSDRSHGDADNDGDTDGSDFLAMQRNFNKTVPAQGSQFSFTPEDNGTYWVSLTVSDGVDSTTKVHEITVGNAVPVISAIDNVELDSIDDPLVLTGTFHDDGTDDTHTASIFRCW